LLLKRPPVARKAHDSASAIGNDETRLVRSFAYR